MCQLQEPVVQSDLAALAVNIVYLLLGIYGWEYVHSLHVERALVCGRLAFRLSMIPYLLARACLLIFLILLAAATSPFSQGFRCIPGILAIALTGNAALGCSSTNFVIRTWVIWKDSRVVRALLLLLALGQWSMLAIDVMNTQSVSIDCFCVVHVKSPQMNAVALIYTTFFDFVVFFLSVVGLSNQRSESPLKKRLRTQGILYCAVAGIAYIPTVVFALLHNAFVFDMTANSAIAISTIASSRAVRSLHSLGTPDPENMLESNVALTTQIGIQQTVIHEDVLSGQRCVDEAADRW